MVVVVALAELWLLDRRVIIRLLNVQLKIVSNSLSVQFFSNCTLAIMLVFPTTTNWQQVCPWHLHERLHLVSGNICFGKLKFHRLQFCRRLYFMAFHSICHGDVFFPLVPVLSEGLLNKFKQLCYVYIANVFYFQSPIFYYIVTSLYNYQ